jgi:all-trans-8'-apo-beta-carotenal 15,15'-oxygenase
MHAQTQLDTHSLSLRGPPTAALRGLDHEHDFQPLRVEGRLPADLRGTLFRNGPARFDIGTRPHWFDGTGAVSAVRLDGASASGAVRITHTPSVDADQQATHPSYGGFRQSFSRTRSLGALFGAPVIRNAANINVLPWQGRLFALYESTLPVELDAQTLANRGETTLNGLIQGAWNAHPHRVASRRAIYQFGVRIGPRVWLDIYELPAQGAARRLHSIALPGVGEVHDFFATDNHLVFVLAPLWCSSLKLLAKRSFVEALEWRANEPTMVLMVPLDAPEKVVRIETEPFFFWHSANAFERANGRELVLDLVRYPDFNVTKRVLDAVSDGQPLGTDSYRGGTLQRGVIDLAGRQVRWQPPLLGECEFPAVHRDVQGREHRYSWLTSNGVHPNTSGWFNTLTRIDTESGARRDIDLGAHCAVSEAAIVPRGNREDDVYVLCLVRDFAADRSWLGIWDGAGRDDEPLARVWFDQLLPAPLHGCWMGA